MLFTPKARQDLVEEITANLKNDIRREAEIAHDNMKDVEQKVERAIAEAREALLATVREEAQQLFQAAMEADRKKRYDDSEPFVEIVSENFDESAGGVQLRLDWNQAFITYLKKNGITGPSDEAIVDNWVVALSRERLAEAGKEYR